jgi:hypothetical protein
VASLACLTSSGRVGALQPAAASGLERFILPIMQWVLATDLTQPFDCPTSGVQRMGQGGIAKTVLGPVHSAEAIAHR